MSESPVRPFVQHDDAYRWSGVELRTYKEDGAAPYRDVTRQTLFSRGDMRGELRYFEVAAAGHSTLERHRHAHAVMVLRGHGGVLVGGQVHPVNTYDLVTVPPLTWHQFRATPDAPLGFLCMVDAERDRPQLPGADDLARLREDPVVAAFLDGAYTPR
ncbi:MAG: cupin domain-containing protein [Betaproteobacteria bacterium]